MQLQGMLRRFSHLIILLLVFVFSAISWGKGVTFASLLEEMTNRDAVAQWPSPAYTCRQSSSYSRLSATPGEASWWANQDRSWFVRVEEKQGRKEYVLMDAEGPGAIVRFWATWHGDQGGPFSNGPLRIYLDGSEEPTLEAPAADLLDGGYLTGPPLSEGVSPLTPPARQGHNLYLPIPYAKRCKITYETRTFIRDGGQAGDAFYYQINYRTYEKATSVRTFSMEDLKTSSGLLEKTQQLLKQGGDEGTDGRQVLSGTIQPAKTVSTILEGGRAIRSMAFKLEADDLSQALRSVVLRIAFDGRPTVWCPIGDFFGIGYRLHPYTTWYSKVLEDGTMECFWVMPFQKQARVTLENLGGEPVTVKTGRIRTGDWSWDDRSLYFHAAWRQWSDIPTRTNEKNPDNGAFDLNWITIEGRGKYVGDVLTLFNGAPRWWGEGDEKIFVDGESFPSHFGTGTEDYYGYAWCRPEPFSSPFHAQPCGEGNLKKGFSVNSRFRSLDAIPFETSLRFDMELWHWAQTTMDYAPTVFWYGDADAAGHVEPMPREAARPVPAKTATGQLRKQIAGAHEGESMRVVRCDGGQTQVQELDTFLWSGGRQLWWRDGRPGQTLVLEFESDQAGPARVYAGLTKARDYGIVDLAINGEPVRQGLDLFNPQGIATELPLGRCRLKQGANRLEVTVRGANPKAVKRYMFGLDYLKFLPASAAESADSSV